MAARQLLWLAPQPQLFDACRDGLHGWEPVHLHIGRKPSGEGSSLPFPRIGVLDLTVADFYDLHFLQDWIEHLFPANWIALLREPLAAGSPPASLIARHCADFHTLPWDTKRLNQSLGHLWGMAAIRHQVAVHARGNAEVRILDGTSDAIAQVRHQLRRYAQTREPVMIFGASGTGKESAARFIHENSVVCRGQFVVVNCASLPESLTQSELFGHEKGAFTSAVSQRIGRIEAAHGGTLLLDGIDELLPQQQSALLRFLQEGLIERLGSQQVRKVDARVISTCSSVPDCLIKNGRLRADLYYRLSMLQARMPLLRERMEDLSPLIGQILAAATADSCSATKRLSKDALLSAIEHHWPGNIRELQNRLRRGALMSRGLVIEPEDMGLVRLAAPCSAGSQFSLQRFREEAEQRAAIHALTVSKQNVSAAARLLNISRLSLYRLIEKYGLDRSTFPRKERRAKAPSVESSKTTRHNKEHLPWQ